MNAALTSLLHLLWSIPGIIPIGILGFVRWGFWLGKKIPAMMYRPIQNDFRCTTTVITPVYKEDPELFRRAVESWIANNPTRIIAVVDTTDQVCADIAAEYPGVEVMMINKPGKRPALAMGVAASTTDIVVLVDSDVIWEPGVLDKVMMPFADPQIGGVGTRQMMYPSDGKKALLWERIADYYLDIRYSDEVPATTLVGRAVSCLSGRTAAYRTKLAQDLEEPFLNETFNGRPCMSGDDKRYTCLTLQAGYYTWNQLNAIAYSTFKPTFDGFVKQRIRWARNTFRSDLRALWQGWVWKHPYLALVLIDKTISPFTLLVGPFVFFTALLLGNWHLVLALLIWLHVSRGIKVLPHLRRVPRDILILPFYILVTYYMTWIKAQALWTINEHKWLTRPVEVIDGVATRAPN